MVWTIIKPDQKLLNKDTRWDRIRKKHTNNLNVKTTLVKKFVDMDFIGKNNIKLMNGDIDMKHNLNPLLVMDMRHEMFQKPKKESPTYIRKYKANIDKCIVHNLEVEEHYIVNELSKFRAQLEKNRQQCKIKPEPLNEDHFNVNNNFILTSLENTTRHIEDFYEAPLQAIEQFDRVLEKIETKDEIIDDKDTAGDSCLSLTRSDEEGNIETSVRFEDPVEVVEHNRKESSFSYTSNGFDAVISDLDEKGNIETRCVRFEEPVEVVEYNRKESTFSYTSNGFDSGISDLDEKGNIETRCVRFEEPVEVVEYNREESNFSYTSNGFDSVISDLAEEALNEIEVEHSFDETGINIHIEGSSLQKILADPLIVTKILPNKVVAIESGFSPYSSSDEEDESVSNEQNAIIEQLYQAKAHSTTSILKNYFLKWIHYTTIQKIERQDVTSKTDRIHKINTFLDHIRREKKNHVPENTSKGVTKIQSINIAKKYQSKIKFQKDVIDLQRMKLERQERLIAELRLNKLSEQAQEDREAIKTELKNAIRTGDSKSRTKARCLQIMGNLRDENDDELVRLQGKAMLQPKFLTDMQERALVRSVKHEQAKQRRLQQEAEREAAKIAMDEAKRLEDEEAKQMRVNLLKEKRRQEKMAKVLKERDRQKSIENHKKSEQFCRHYLLRRVGMEGFKRILERKIANQRKSDNLRKQMIQKNVFCAWRRLCLIIYERKINLADELHDRITKRIALKAWISYLQDERSKYLVAVDWYELKLNQVLFTHWCGYTKLQKLVVDTKMKQAELHHEWHLKWKVLDRWQRLPLLLKLEKETDERRQRWRMKIWELLPDYTPNRDQIL